MAREGGGAGHEETQAQGGHVPPSAAPQVRSQAGRPACTRLSGYSQGRASPLRVLMALGCLQVPAPPAENGVVVRPITRGTHTEENPFVITERVDGAWLSI